MFLWESIDLFLRWNRLNLRNIRESPSIGLIPIHLEPKRQLMLAPSIVIHQSIRWFFVAIVGKRRLSSVAHMVGSQRFNFLFIIVYWVAITFLVGTDSCEAVGTRPFEFPPARSISLPSAIVDIEPPKKCTGSISSQGTCAVGTVKCFKHLKFAGRFSAKKKLLSRLIVVIIVERNI